MTTPQPSLTSHPQELMTESAIERAAISLRAAVASVDDHPDSFFDENWKYIDKLEAQAKLALSLTEQLAQEKERADGLVELLWTLYEGLYGHRKAEHIDFAKTAVGGALEVNKAWRERGMRADERATAAERQLAEARKDKDEAYRQRNHVVAALAHIYPSGIRRSNIEGWDAEWHGCVYIDLPSGQISYHYHDSQAQLFADLPPYIEDWDGHSKEIVHQRLAALPPAAAVEGGEGNG